MGVEWFENLFKAAQDKNQKDQQDRAYSKKEQEIRQKEIADLAEINEKALEEIVELLKKAHK
jgi:hypothetical protein